MATPYGKTALLLQDADRNKTWVTGSDRKHVNHWKQPFWHVWTRWCKFVFVLFIADPSN